uniref:Uncharacterized protein n=1 Tax=Megaviridae environmental sample TaxID=1737588 RepID=A0A5J6VID2_9VIRU|nr:MAG: hypothetical protein [Megaviridae environmental sample]
MEITRDIGRFIKACFVLYIQTKFSFRFNILLLAIYGLKYKCKSIEKYYRRNRKKDSLWVFAAMCVIAITEVINGIIDAASEVSEMLDSAIKTTPILSNIYRWTRKQCAKFDSSYIQKRDNVIKSWSSWAMNATVGALFNPDDDMDVSNMQDMDFMFNDMKQFNDQAITTISESESLENKDIIFKLLGKNKTTNIISMDAGDLSNDMLNTSSINTPSTIKQPISRKARLRMAKG